MRRNVGDVYSVLIRFTVLFILGEIGTLMQPDFIREQIFRNYLNEYINFIDTN